MKLAEMKPADVALLTSVLFDLAMRGAQVAQLLRSNVALTTEQRQAIADESAAERQRFDEAIARAEAEGR